MLSGALAAAVTPLRDGGTQLDEEVVGPLVDFLARGGLTGILALGTTGEGILFSVEERKRIAKRFMDVAPAGFAVAVHCGAQSTADTVALAAHSAEIGAAAVAVVAPPYFPLDERALLAHFSEAARACAPVPFYVYELERASGYAVPVPVIRELLDITPNLVGMKVSDAPWERFAPYLIDGLDIFVGAESLIHRAMNAGAVGAVSALATAFPEAVSDAVRTQSEEQSEYLATLRAGVERFPRHAALKRVLASRGVPISEDVRAPLRALKADEQDEIDRLLPEWLTLEGSGKTEGGEPFVYRH